MLNYSTPPANVRELQKRIAEQEGDESSANRRQNRMALVVLSQLLPDGVVKGGGAMALRYGSDARMTPDFDTARRLAEEDFEREFEKTLQQGWSGFTGTLTKKYKSKIDGLPDHYVTPRYSVKIFFKGENWKSRKFELAHNELGGADLPDYFLSDDLALEFTAIGLERPDAVPLLRVENQIAQKLHAVSYPGSPRAHDLIDLQILEANEDIDYSTLRDLCIRTFSYRGEHEWPPTVVKGDENWSARYEQARSELGEAVTVLKLDDAVEWCNKFIQRVTKAL